MNCTSTPGRLLVDYVADVTGRAAPARRSPQTDRLAYLRPSRYAESDRLEAVARAEFGGVHGARDLLDAVSSWVGSRLAYEPGSSGPTDGAVDTLLAHRGVCRDYAHLVTALAARPRRARPAGGRIRARASIRWTSMPSSRPWSTTSGGPWTRRCSPRAAACCGSPPAADAADTAFLSNYGGAVTLLEMAVSAWTDGELPTDDVTRLVSLG